MTNSLNGIGILGSGAMGKRLALLCAAHGMTVVLWNRRRHDGLVEELGKMARMEARLGTIAVNDARGLGERIHYTDDMVAVEGVQAVIESVVDEYEAKRQVLGRVSAVVSGATLISTNTSTLSVAALSEAVYSPERFLGTHFFNPPTMLRLVEIVRGPHTADEAVARAEALMAALNKKSVTVPDSPGFVVNRLLFAMINEAIFMLAEGALDERAIDQCMKLGVNHPMGPLELADLIGLDVCLSILRTLERETGDAKYRPAPLLVAQVEAGRLGKKAGGGFFSYRRREQ